MSEEVNEAAEAAREAMELLRRRKRLTNEDKKHLEELYARWRGVRDHAWQEAEKKVEDTLRRKR
jgi:mRNA-degrading endonuclease YafQ of YafQ-DinJ toxin-antitoxin module